MCFGCREGRSMMKILLVELCRRTRATEAAATKA